MSPAWLNSEVTDGTLDFRFWARTGNASIKASAGAVTSGQIGEVCGHPPRLVLGEQLSRRSSAGLAVEVHAGKRLAAASLCVVSDVGNRSAPRVMTTLAGVVHDRQGAAYTQCNNGDENQ
jgi:hypothetical protein